MGFRAITAAFKAQIQEHQDREVTQAMVEEVENLLEEYCSTLEDIYGLGLNFDVEISDEDGRLRYAVTPETELDTLLLAHITADEATIARPTFRLQ